MSTKSRLVLASVLICAAALDVTLVATVGTAWRPPWAGLWGGLGGFFFDLTLGAGVYLLVTL